MEGSTQDVSLLSMPDEVVLSLFDLLDQELSRPVAFRISHTHRIMSSRPGRAVGPRHAQTRALAQTCRRFTDIYKNKFCEIIDTDIPGYYRREYARAASSGRELSPRIRFGPLLRAMSIYENAKRLLYDGSPYAFDDVDTLRVWSMPQRWQAANRMRAISEEERCLAFWEHFSNVLHGIVLLHINVILTRRTARSILKCFPQLLELELSGRGYPYATAAEIPVDPSEEGCVTLLENLPSSLRRLYLADVHMRSDGILQELKHVTSLQTLILIPFTLSLGPRNIDAIVHHSASLTHLALEPRVGIFDWGLEEICEMIGSLTELSRIRFSRAATVLLSHRDALEDSSLSALLQARPPGLSEFYLENDQLSIDFERFEADMATIQGSTNLRSLGIEGHFSTLRVEECMLTSVEFLSITSASFDQLELQTAISSLPNLRSIRLGFCDGVSDRVATAILQLPSLERLCLIGCPLLTDGGISQGLVSSKSILSLRTIDLTACEEVGDGCVQAFQWIPNLIELSMTETSLTAVGLRAILQECTRLEKLYIPEGFAHDIDNDGRFHLDLFRETSQYNSALHDPEGPSSIEDGESHEVLHDPDIREANIVDSDESL